MMLHIIIKTFNFAIKSIKIIKIESYYQNKAITKKEKEKKKFYEHYQSYFFDHDINYRSCPDSSDQATSP